jgi:hypothetical protein
MQGVFASETVSNRHQKKNEKQRLTISGPAPRSGRGDLQQHHAATG